MEYKLTDAAKNVWDIAEGLAKELGHLYIGTEHILYGLVKDDLGVVSEVFKENNVNDEKIENTIIDIIGRRSKLDRIKGVTTKLRSVLEMAAEESKKIGSDFIGTEQLIVCLFSDKDSFGYRLANDCGINTNKFLKDLYKKIYSESDEVQSKKRKIGELDKYGIDLVDLAKNNKIDGAFRKRKRD